MVLIKIGIESDATQLHSQISMHPEICFFILITEGHAALCVQTCSSSGDDILVHEVDGLTPDSDGNLISEFGCDLQDAVAKQELYMEYLEGERYPLSHAVKKKIKELPGFIDWVMASSPVKGRCLMLYPTWSI